MRFLKRFLLISIFVGILSVKPLTDRMPEPMKTAFSNVRETAMQVASGDGISMPDINRLRGLWAPAPNDGIQHVGGR